MRNLRKKKMEDFNNGLDGNLAYRMRKVNPEQFYTLVRMHLSFELDLTSEENDVVTEKAKLKKWGILPFTKKAKASMNASKNSEGTVLTKELISQMKQLVTYLSEEKCLEQEGIFRRTGKLTRQQELKAELSHGQPLNLEDSRYNVHDCASVLKGFLADLSEPLLTDLYYPIYCQIADLYSAENSENEGRLTRSIQFLLLLIPSTNRILLRHILRLLNKTAAHESSNKMNCNTLATLFTPHLLCPRNLAPEALHANSQSLSGLVSFIIKKGEELFEVPTKLMTDIRAFWIEQEKNLLSPKKPDPNESTSDMTGTARTVFSFVDHQLTAKATETQDTQAALAQLYAHIQSMPESAKKRRLVKKFNKENGQGTPRHIKNSGQKKSLGDSIKKHIFQKKVLCNKKIIDVKFTCNFSRSSSEENILSNTSENSMLLKKAASKSDDDLSSNSFKVQDNLIVSKKLSSSYENLDHQCDVESTKSIGIRKEKENDIENVANISEVDNSNRRSRHSSEPPNLYISSSMHENSELQDQNSETELFVTRSSDAGLTTDSENLSYDQKETSAVSTEKSNEKQTFTSPLKHYKLRNRYAIHTSTPSNLLRKSLGLCDYILTPINDDEKSTSPITQSATKMSKAMQETMMTPRSRKPVVMISTSNICNLSTLNSSPPQNESRTSLQTVTCNSIDEEVHNSLENIEKGSNDSTINKDEQKASEPSVQKDTQENITCINTKSFTNRIVQKTINTNISTFKEYRLSRSVLTASPVDLSFTSRTGDFEQSESDINSDDKNRMSDIIDIDSNSLSNSNNSYSNRYEDASPLLRKRSTSLHRDDWKRPIKNESNYSNFASKEHILKEAQLKETTLSLSKQNVSSETSF